MAVNSTEKIGGFLSYLDNRGLTDKAIRVRNLWDLIDKVNAKVQQELKSLNIIFFTDPGTIVSNQFFDKDSLEEISLATFKGWDDTNFPFKETFFVRTATFDNTHGYTLPNSFIDIDPSNKLAVVDNLLTFIKETNPDQIIVHPRISVKEAMNGDLIAFRAHSTVENMVCEFGTGGINSIRDIEKAEKFTRFNFNDLNNPNIPNEFKTLAKGFRLIIEFADEYISTYAKRDMSNIFPIYEMKCFLIDGVYYINLFDYEIA
jgi:hypothetical protein